MRNSASVKASKLEPGQMFDLFGKEQTIVEVMPNDYQQTVVRFVPSEDHPPESNANVLIVPKAQKIDILLR